MDTPTDEKLQEWLNAAHMTKNALLKPVEERQAAARAISDSIMVAAEYRAQRNALQLRVAELEEKLRAYES